MAFTRRAAIVADVALAPRNGIVEIAGPERAQFNEIVARWHGGAPGSGAPRGNQNALKHGMYTREALEERRLVQDLLRQSRMLIQEIK